MPIGTEDDEVLDVRAVERDWPVDEIHEARLSLRHAEANRACDARGFVLGYLLRSDREATSTLQQLKSLSESRNSMHRELVELRDVRDAALEVTEAMEIPQKDGDEPLTLARRLRRVPGAFERFVSTITRQYVGHILGLVKSYWPTTRLDALEQRARADCSEDKFRQYLTSTSRVADQIVESLSKAKSP